MNDKNEVITTGRSEVTRRAEDMRLEEQVLKVRIGEVEISILLSEINIVIGGQQTGGRREATFFRCGNCAAKLPRTGDPERDHHTAMRHRIEDCQKSGVAVNIEQRQLVEEFEAQDHVPVTRRLLGAQPPTPRKRWFGL